MASSKKKTKQKTRPRAKSAAKARPRAKAAAARPKPKVKAGAKARTAKPKPAPKSRGTKPKASPKPRQAKAGQAKAGKAKAAGKLPVVRTRAESKTGARPVRGKKAATDPSTATARTATGRASEKKGAEGKAAATGRSAGPPLRKPSRKSRRSGSRRLDTRNYVPGEVLLAGGAQDGDEIYYLLRGCVAAEEPATEAGVGELRAKGVGQNIPDDVIARGVEEISRRFDDGPVEPRLPERQQGVRHTFASVVERARHRRREIGAFLRGLDLGGTETSHMDPHGEASLQSLMEWAARLEVLTEADEPGQADYTQFHKVLDQLELNTEALILDVEQTLRRLRDHVR